MGKKSEKIVKTPVIVESTESKVIDQVVEQVVEQVVVDAEVNMDPQFLMQELKKVPLEGVVKNTYEALKALKKLDAPQRVFVLKYEKEVERLKNNSSSILSKRTAKAKELNLSFKFPDEQSKLKKLFAIKPEDIFSKREKESVISAIEKKIVKMKKESDKNFNVPIFTENDDIRDMRVDLNYLSINLDLEA